MTPLHHLRTTTAGWMVFASLVVCGAVNTNGAIGVTPFGPETFTRKAGKPVTETRAFTVADTSRAYTLHVRNDGVASAVIQVNGRTILGPEDFERDERAHREDDDRRDRDGRRAEDEKDKKHNDGDRNHDRDGTDEGRPLERRVTLRSSNQLSIELRGEPGRSLTVWITCDNCDSTPPTITASAVPPPNAAGWNNTSVTVAFACADAESGIATCPAPLSLEREGAGQAATGTAVDRAGNMATASLLINIDKTAPTISVEAPGATTPWYRGPVAVSFNCSDALSGVASCTEPSTVTGDGLHTVTGRATDRAGNSASADVTIRIDSTPPTIGVVATPVANAAGWRTGDVTVTFTCVDTGSGIATCPMPIQVTTEGASQLITGTAIDRAGNTSVASIAVSVDKTPPSLVASVFPPPNASGWNNADVTVSFTCSDAMAGVASCPEPVSVHGDAAGQVIARTAVDAAGNSSTASVTVNIDTKPPSISAVKSPAANVAGWNSGDVTVTFTCADTGSGIATCPAPILVTTEGPNQVVTGTAIDRAGNTSAASIAVSVDKTPPSIVASVLPPPNASGWNNVDVTVSFNCSDAMSGVASCPEPVSVHGDVAEQVVARTAVDAAGNSSTATVTVKIDGTSPSISAVKSPAANAAGWNNRDVTVTFNCDDVGSGVATCPAPILVTTEGSNQVVTGTAIDRAGNTSVASIAVSVDKTPPAVVPSLQPQPNASGWNNSDVTVTFACADTGSGVASCPAPVSVSAEGSNQPVTGTVVDKAGNSASVTVPVSLDKTPATIAATVAPLPNAAGWNKTSVTVSFTCEDAGSGVAGCPDPVVVAGNGAGQVVSRSAVDRAGNTSTATATLNIDMAPPTIQVTAPSDGAVLTTASVTLVGTVADSGSGIASATCNNQPALVVTGGVTCVSLLAAGANSLTITATDVAGNVSSGSVAVTYNADHRPTAKVSAPASAIAGEPVQFDAGQSVDSDQDALIFTWDFGDGSTAAGPSPSHAFESAGVFVVSLTADDGRGGVDTVTIQLDVAAAVVGIGRGVITGRAFDEADGRPIRDASVDLTASSPGPFQSSHTLTDPLGRYRLSVPAGPARLRVTRDGYTSSVRRVDVVDGKRVDPFDARLTALDGKAVTVTSVLGNVVSNTAGDVRVTIGAGAVAVDASLRLTKIGATGLIATLPLGWSPIAALDLAPAGISWNTAAPLTIAAPAGFALGATLTLARWDAQASAWIADGPVTMSGDRTLLQGALTQTGQYVVVTPDPAPNAPQSPAVGQPLAGVDPAAVSEASVTITPSPKILFASTSARAQVRVAVEPIPPIPSGSPLQLDVTESYSLTDASTLVLARTTRRLPLYRFDPAGGAATTSSLQSQTVATPSRAFAPFRLQRGAIDLAARLPAVSSPYGAIVTTAGGSVVDAAGDRLVVPSGASQEDLPVSLTRLDPSDVPMPIPSALGLLGAVEVDLHGVTLSVPAQLSIPVPDGFSESAPVLVVRLSEIDGVTRLELIAVTLVDGASLVASVDPHGDGSLPFPGVRGEGWYLFLKPAQAVGFVTGIANALDGTPLVGALVSGGTLGLVAVADAQGRYTIASATGDTTFVTTNVATGDQGGFTAHVDAAAVASGSSSVGQTPLAVTAIVPADGAATIPLASVVRVSFSGGLDPASIAGAVSLASDGGAVDGTIAVSSDGRSLVFRPGTVLASNTVYRVSIGGGLRSVSGRPLTAPTTAHFRTINLTPPAVPPAGAVSATIPDASGLSTVSGTQGTVDPGGLVLVKNLTTGAITTLTPNANGSFGGSVVSAITDRLQLTLKDAVGNSTTVPVAPFRNADGSTVVGSAGGRVVGGGGTFVDVPAGALPEGTVVKIDAAAASDFPLPAPAEYPFVGGIRLDLGGAKSTTSLHVGIVAPADATPDEQILVGSPLRLKDRATWTLVDRAHFANGSYVTESWPFPSVLNGGVFGYFRPATGTCLSFVNVLVDFAVPLLIEESTDFFSFLSDVQSIVLAKRCESALNIQVSDPVTQAVIRQLTATAPSTNGAIGSVPGILTDDNTAPQLTKVNTFTGQQVDHIEVQFSKPMEPESVKGGLRVFQVADSPAVQNPQPIDGTVDLSASNTIATFRPKTPFQLGRQYKVTFVNMIDAHGQKPLVADPQAFTPFAPLSLNGLSAVAPFGDALQKCAGGSCNTSVRDNVVIGNVQFLANGLANAGERYSLYPPESLIAVDVSDVTSPIRIGFSGNGSNVVNPRVLGTVENVLRVTLPDLSLFRGNLLLVASGGRILDDVDLPSKLELYDVTSCKPGIATNCLDGLRKGVKYLSTPTGEAPRRGVPLEAGVPQQMAVLHQPGTTGQSGTTSDDIIAAYVVVSSVGLEAVDITHTFNEKQLEDSSVSASVPLGPDGFVRGGFLDVAVVKNQVAAVELDPSGAFNLDLYSAQLTDKHTIALPGPAARVAIVTNLLALPAVDSNGHSISANERLFDLALVSSGPLDSCPSGSLSPCGEIDVIDLSAQTDLRHASTRGIARIPMPGAAFSIKVDQDAAVAYVEVRGKGLVILDLTNIVKAIQGGVSPTSLQDTNGDGIDDRVLAVIAQPDIFSGRINVDTARGVAFINSSVTGITTVEVANRCKDLTADFGQANASDPSRSLSSGHADTEQPLSKEKTVFLDLLTRAAERLKNANPPITKVVMLEQGSGACFWRTDFPQSCTAFTPGVSDHDIEVMVPQDQVEHAQDELDKFMNDEKNNSTSDIWKTVSLFGFSRDAYEAAELLNGTPQNSTGDPTGDLAMGRQLLLVLWTLDGEYVTGFEPKDQFGEIVPIDTIVDKLKAHPPIIPGEPSAIPLLEGYEWSLLQEMNLYKTGAMLRVLGGCSSGSPLVDAPGPFNEVNDRDANFGEPGLFSQDCQDQIHSVAKAGIRTAMAMLAANKWTNPKILDIDVTRTKFREDGCLTGVHDARNPPAVLAPTDANGIVQGFPYHSKPCSGFEEYIASVAIKSVRDQDPANPGPFTAAQLPQIFKFFCAKVGEQHCPTNRDFDGQRDGDVLGAPLFTTDREANEFIASTLDFIRHAQETTFQAYHDSVGLDTKQIKHLGSNDPNAILVFPFLDKIRTVCDKNGVAGINTDSPRSALRECNKNIVAHKVEGDSSDVLTPAAQPVEMLIGADGKFDKTRAAALQHYFGAKRLVLKDLRARVSNLSAHDISDTTVRLAFGDGADQTKYQTLRDLKVQGLTAGSNRVLDVDSDQKPIFPVAFTLPNLLPVNVPKAVAFFVDPDRLMPEASKKDNQAAFYFYQLDPTQTDGPQAVSPPVSVIRDLTSDALCRAPSAFNLTLNLRDVRYPASTGKPSLTVSIGQRVELQYLASNPGKELKQLNVHRTRVTGLEAAGTGGSDTVFTTASLPPTSPSTPGLPFSEDFTPTSDGSYFIQATADALDSKGNTVWAESPRVVLTVTRVDCATAVKTLDPDPNPFDPNTSQPVSTIMLGGTLYRYYRVLDGKTGQPVASAKINVSARQWPNGTSFDLPALTSDANGYLTHQSMDQSDDVRGLSIAADALGSPNQQFLVTLNPGDTDATKSCGQQFTVAITDRQYSRSFAAGASLNVSAKKLWGPFGISGGTGVGFELSQDATASTRKDLRLGRTVSSNAKLGVGGSVSTTQTDFKIPFLEPKGAATKWVLNNVSGASLDASLGAELMVQDEHAFGWPLDQISCLQAGLLVEGGLMTAAFATQPVPIPGFKLIGLALDELAQRATGLENKRTALGGSVGITVGGGGSLTLPPVFVDGTGLSFFDGKNVALTIDASVAATAGAGLSYAPQTRELAGTFSVKFALEAGEAPSTEFNRGAGDTERSVNRATDDVDVDSFSKLVDKLKGEVGGQLAGTVSVSLVWDAESIQTSLSMKKIKLSLSMRKTWGITGAILDGVESGTGGSGSTRKWSFTISNPQKFARALDSLATIAVVEGVTGANPIGAYLAGKEFAKLIEMADSYSIGVVDGQGGEVGLGVSELIKKLSGKFEDLPSVGAKFKFDQSVAHDVEFGSVRRGGMFKTATYPTSGDRLIPSPDSSPLLDTLTGCFGSAADALSSAYDYVKASIAKGTGAAPTTVQHNLVLPASTQQPLDHFGGPSADDPVGAEQDVAPQAGVELVVDGAAEPDPATPFDVELVAFQFRARTGSSTPVIPSPLDIAGPADQPHYGVGGFFQFVPNRRTLAAPAQLTIHYLASEVAGFDERKLAIYAWNDSRADWDFVGGTVDAINHTITASVVRLGMYTAALPMPAGAIVLTAQSQTSGTGLDTNTTVTYTSDVIRLNNGAPVPDGMLFSVMVVDPGSSDLDPFGTVTTADEDAVTDGVQVTSHNGTIQFTADLPGAGGIARPIVISSLGTALAKSLMAFP